MKDILLFLLVHCGGVYVVTQSLLTKLPRERFHAWVRKAHAGVDHPAELFLIVLPLAFILAVVQCPACFGFWWALLLNYLSYWPFEAVTYQPIEAALGGTAIGALWSFHTTAEVADATTKEKTHE